MLHNVHLLQKRFPRQAGRIMFGAVALSVSALAIGAGLLLLG